jgi:hypothetical protein
MPEAARSPDTVVSAFATGLSATHRLVASKTLIKIRIRGGREKVARTSP